MLKIENIKKIIEIKIKKNLKFEIKKIKKN